MSAGGSRHSAAQRLYLYLIQQPDAFKQLVEGLRHSSVGLTAFADKLDPPQSNPGNHFFIFSSVTACCVKLKKSGLFIFFSQTSFACSLSNIKFMISSLFSKIFTVFLVV